MSTRWSYGPDGLRERPVKSWSDGIALPRWRDVQPLLIRSAGVVGIVATIMAVVASDAFREGEETAGEADATIASAAVNPAPTVIAAAELRPAAEPEPPLAQASEGETVELAAVAADASDPAAPPPPVDAPRVEPAPAAALPVAGTEIASLQAASDAPPPSPPDTATPMAPIAAAAPAAPDVAESLPLMDLRRGPASPEAATASPVTTASVLATYAAPAPAPTPPEPASLTAAGPAAAARVPIAELTVPDDASETPAAAEAPPAGEVRSAVSAVRGTEVMPVVAAAVESEGCVRDWIAAEGGEEPGADCVAIAALIPPVAEDAREALEAAAAEHAELLASLPRIPQARPEPPPDFKPEKPRPQRVSARRSDWPADPPPNCGAGKHAKWRFVDRAANTKEWYCR